MASDSEEEKQEIIGRAVASKSTSLSGVDESPPRRAGGMMIADTPDPPYYAVIFTSLRRRRRRVLDDDHSAVLCDDDGTSTATSADASSAAATTKESTKKDDDDEYMETANRMIELASHQEGFLGIESVRNGLQSITVSYWTSLESIKKWKHNCEHLEAQDKGQRQWYSAYKTRICLVERDYSF